ncbi:hypothetical protein O4J55_26805, partial [Paracoccus sp. PXZ]
MAAAKPTVGRLGRNRSGPYGFRGNLTGVAALRILSATVEYRIVPPSPLHHLPDQTAGTLIEFHSVDGLEPDVVPG